MMIDLVPVGGREMRGVPQSPAGPPPAPPPRKRDVASALPPPTSPRPATSSAQPNSPLFSPQLAQQPPEPPPRRRPVAPPPTPPVDAQPPQPPPRRNRSSSMAQTPPATTAAAAAATASTIAATPIGADTAETPSTAETTITAATISAAAVSPSKRCVGSPTSVKLLGLLVEAGDDTAPTIVSIVALPKPNAATPPRSVTAPTPPAPAAATGATTASHPRRNSTGRAAFWVRSLLRRGSSQHQAASHTAQRPHEPKRTASSDRPTTAPSEPPAIVLRGVQPSPPSEPAVPATPTPVAASSRPEVSAQEAQRSWMLSQEAKFEIWSPSDDSSNEPTHAPLLLAEPGKENIRVVSVDTTGLKTKTRGKGRSSVKDGTLRALFPGAGNSLRQATM